MKIKNKQSCLSQEDLEDIHVYEEGFRFWDEECHCDFEGCDCSSLDRDPYWYYYHEYLDSNRKRKIEMFLLEEENPLKEQLEKILPKVKLKS